MLKHIQGIYYRVEMPKGAERVEIKEFKNFYSNEGLGEYYLFFDCMKHSIPNIPLPSGEWELVGMTEELDYQFLWEFGEKNAPITTVTNYSVQERREAFVEFHNLTERTLIIKKLN